MENKNENSIFKKHPWIWVVIGLIGFSVLSKMCKSDVDLNGSLFPFDDQFMEDKYIEQEILEGKAENERIKNDPCLQDIINGVPPEYQRCDENLTSNSNASLDTSSEREFVSSTSCLCSHNAYNCKDFSTQSLAQDCYDYCSSIGKGDIHWLDDDNDGIACEWNP